MAQASSLQLVLNEIDIGSYAKYKAALFWHSDSLWVSLTFIGRDRSDWRPVAVEKAQSRKKEFGLST